MDKNQETFAYTNEEVASLVQSLSTARLGAYLTRADGDQKYAIKLYEWNTALSESFYGVLQGLEVTIRNSMHRVLTAAYGCEDWYDHCGLQYDQQEAIKKAKKRIMQDGKVVRPDKVIAELTFGFWVALTGPSYAQALWDPHLHKAFAVSLGRKTAHKRLERIRKLRNRVAHHESILARNLKSDYGVIIEAVHWICPVTARWLKANNSFHPRFRAMPSKQMTLDIAAAADKPPGG